MSKIKTDKTKNFRSLTVTLAIVFLALSAVVLLIVGSLNMYLNFRNQQRTVAFQQKLIAQEAANTVSSFLQDKFRVLASAVRFSDLATARKEEQKLLLEKLLGIEPAFRQLVLLDTQQQELLRSSRVSDLVSGQLTEQIDSELCPEVNQEQMYISSIYIERVTSEPLVIMAVPAKDVFSDVKGTLIAEVNLKFMWDLVSNIKIGRNGLAYVIDEHGNLIAFRDIGRVLKGENLSYLKEVDEVINRDRSVQRDDTDIAKGIQGNYVATTHVRLDAPDWAVVVELPILEVYETVIRAISLSMSVMLFSFVLSLIASIHLSKRITKPVINLRDATRRISKGDLNTKIEVKSRDEIGELAASFNQMVEDLNKTTVSRDSLMKEVAERRKVEEQLRKTEEKYRTQFEGALDAIFVADAKTGIIVDCNPAATRLVGRGKSELIGKHQRILHPLERIEGGFSKTFKEHLKEQQGQVLETQVLTKTGEIKDVAIKTNLIEVRGKKILQGIFRDITERKKAEAALRKSEERFKQVAESAGDWIWEVNTEGLFTYSSYVSEKILGYKPEEIVGKKHFYDFFTTDVKEELKEAALEAFAKGERIVAFLNPNVHKNGSTVILETNGTPIVDDKGNLWGYRGADRDITERKKAEEQQGELLNKLEKVNNELKDFAYIISHDLKAPLRGISTLSEWIATDYADKLDEDGKEQLKLLSTRVDRMHNLIEGVLQYSRIGRVKEAQEQVDLNELVSEVIDMICPPENITISIENELPTITCEKTRIMQVFQNLLSNAVKYMDKPDGRIRIGCADEDGFWRFSVTDNGPGIEEKYFEKIFQIFQTLSAKDDFESTGVGLTVTKKIVELYGGRIWVESTPKEGTTFFFSLLKQEMEIENAEYQTNNVS